MSMHDYRQETVDVAGVVAVLEEVLGPGIRAVDAAADLRDAFGDDYNSLTALECIVAIERHYGITVDFVDDDVRHGFSAVANISELVGRKSADLEVLNG